MFEVWVVDNASSDGSAQMVSQRFPRVRLIENCKNLGFAVANNQAIRSCDGDYALLLNSDAILLPGVIEVLLDFMAKHPDVGALGGKVLDAHRDFQSAYATDFPSPADHLLLVLGLGKYVHTKYQPEHLNLDVPNEAAWLGGSCLLLRTQAVRQIGLFDERFFMYAEEVDLCHRLRRHGYRNYYLPLATAIHYGGQSSALAPLECRVQLHKSRLLYSQKYHGRGAVLLLRGAVAAVASLKLLKASVDRWILRQCSGSVDQFRFSTELLKLSVSSLI